MERHLERKLRTAEILARLYTAAPDSRETVASADKMDA